ncbi:uncharacterized protein PgNI_08775, partial [Pyricularia grisea]|uniref:Uncharacterized protein n=1 Tax=Pyricularia grisea TaxID=148305 RepID=A0A6P8AVN7_PYRGI
MPPHQLNCMIHEHALPVSLTVPDCSSQLLSICFFFFFSFPLLPRPTPHVPR